LCPKCKHWVEISGKYPNPSDWQVEQETLNDKKKTELLPGTILILKLLIQHCGFYHGTIFAKYLENIKGFATINGFADRVYWAYIKDLEIDDFFETVILEDYSTCLLNILGICVKKIPIQEAASPPAL